MPFGILVHTDGDVSCVRVLHNVSIPPIHGKQNRDGANRKSCGPIYARNKGFVRAGRFDDLEERALRLDVLLLFEEGKGDGVNERDKKCTITLRYFYSTVTDFAKFRG